MKHWQLLFIVENKKRSSCLDVCGGAGQQHLCLNTHPPLRFLRARGTSSPHGAQFRALTVIHLVASRAVTAVTSASPGGSEALTARA